MSQIAARVRVASSLVALSLVLSLDALAAQRTFVSTAGSDSNTASNCSNTLPCRGFTAALTVTDSGGEMIVKDSGGYGPVAINKSVSIIAPDGLYSGISVPSGVGVSIATAGVKVVLHGLTINSLGGVHGISMSDGSELTVENCHISNFAGDGYRGLLVGTPATVSVLHTRFLDNTIGADFESGAQALVQDSTFSGGAYGIIAYANGGDTTNVNVNRTASSFSGSGYHAYAESGGVSTMSISNSIAHGNSTGFHAYALDAGTVVLDVQDSAASANIDGGAVDTGGGTVRASFTRNLITRNSSHGLTANAGAALTASANTLRENGTGMAQSGGALFRSTADNVVVDNGAASSGTITPQAKL